MNRERGAQGRAEIFGALGKVGRLVSGSPRVCFANRKPMKNVDQKKKVCQKNYFWLIQLSFSGNGENFEKKHTTKIFTLKFFWTWKNFDKKKNFVQFFSFAMESFSTDKTEDKKWCLFFDPTPLTNPLTFFRLPPPATPWENNISIILALTLINPLSLVKLHHP